ncbi:aminomethyl-transferring glycine dehydrogenase [Permianibacter aggregans]|uniref:Glycine dehydrogenase (decarboxylating) n=1 Tax=Permianibacter aggregans TaxID=1510150 RepID=A0A4R6UGA3_9GAMM|nr:aminomethyl-transferring glycine dehydrogenase [Permianibacter aggregans]QGX40325.1 glycine dehydrogenase (aminomethyl-transferring) [Permianibacter aggregans]TDQ44243.1 glycine dehydrogenase [Permianibacter aggregans]
MSQPSLTQLEKHDGFVARHIGPSDQEISAMLQSLGVSTLEELTTQIVPESIRLREDLALKPAMSEHETLQYLKKLAGKNKIYKSFIGTGYYDTITPPVILRNVLENPGWYTAYTPYQPEIAQGRLETLLNYQQMVVDLTGLAIANASLLDEATAAAEAMALARRGSKSKSNLFFIDEDTHPQTIDVTRTRADAYGFETVVGPVTDALKHDYFGVLLSYPSSSGQVNDLSGLIAALQERKTLVTLATDLLALCVLKSPGELGADIAIGSAQRFGVPFGFGGPHAAFLAAKDEFKRSMPGRIIGVSVDKRGNKALRMAMQTREQHIRREKANSNICTAQVLLSNMAALYAMYHGPQGLKDIATRVHRLMAIFVAGMRAKGAQVDTKAFFDTVTIDVGAVREQVYMRALSNKMNLRLIGDSKLCIAFDEKTTRDDVKVLWEVFLQDEAEGLSIEQLDALYAAEDLQDVPDQLQRTSEYLSHPVFNKYHSETDMLRYLKMLENKDFSLTHGMIPLGSCTMKLNATTEMMPVTWPEFGNIHPFAPLVQAQGYLDMIHELEHQLKAITGFDAISIQPNSGAQGEYAGLLTIRKYHESRGEGHRTICLIPQSAHGTNPASAQMANYRVVVTACDKEGNIDFADLEAKVKEHADNLACLMMTYPSTHGVYEEGAKKICDLIHAHGGQVYMDGANLNAQVGLTMPARIGADVSHMNLHKTFCIPHGGGGPGMGPIGVRAHLAPFLPNHAVVHLEGPNPGNGAVSAAPWGSASILPISWSYIAMMGGEGLRRATQVAILNANYMMKRLSEHYPVLYTGRNDRVAHECIIDIRPIKEASGISEEDIAKRLMDYGFHAPTMSFPVAGTLMIEPTESESKEELDRFCDAMIAIKKEIDNVQSGKWPLDNNPLVNAPHTLADITEMDWNRPYSREEAVFPMPGQKANKFWPAVNRIDNVYGDRNLFCVCPPMEDYAA